MAGVDEDNYVNQMQEYLQMLCPTGRCETLWRYQDHPANRQEHYRVQILLINTGPDSDADLPQPFSNAYSRKKDAQKNAAKLCLESLERTGARPHDPSVVPLMVGVDGRSGGGNGQNASVLAASLPGLLPELDPESLRAIVPVVLLPSEASSEGKNGRLSLAKADDDACAGYSSDSSDSDDNDLISAVENAKGDIVSAPSDLGRLGEKFALAWLQEQSWVKPDSLVWLNDDSETQHDHDLECVPLSSPGRAHIEVKTRWRRFKGAAARPRQRERLLDPDDDYMLLVVGFFEEFLVDDKPPRIRLLPNCKWEDKELVCLCCKKQRFVWTVSEQKQEGIAIVRDRQSWPRLCSSCKGEIRRKHGRNSEVHVCPDCRDSWIYTEGEQRFIKRKGFTAPKRCKDCRRERRAAEQQTGLA
jgi:Zn-finger nucleic acid-binding protein